MSQNGITLCYVIVVQHAQKQPLCNINVAWVTMACIQTGDIFVNNIKNKNVTTDTYRQSTQKCSRGRYNVWIS